MKLLCSFLLLAVAGATAYGQPTNGAPYWSTSVPNCNVSGVNGPVQITNSSGAVIGYSCYVSGTFLWLAAGSVWSSSIRIAAPASGAIGIDYTFYDQSGNDLSLDTKINNGSVASGSDVNFALYPNQPAEVKLLGQNGGGPSYSNLVTGSAYAVIYCPDGLTCSIVSPQLLYSALPTFSWTLSVPIGWDGDEWTQWSAQGLDDGGVTRRVSLVIYNQGSVAASYTVRLYDQNGILQGTGTTPSIPPWKPLAGGQFGQGGTYGALLADIVPQLNSNALLKGGIFKVLVDGGTENALVQVLQFTSAAASSLQVAYDTAPVGASASMSLRRTNRKSQDLSLTPKQVFAPLQQ